MGKKPRWLRQALDHRTGTVLAYVFGRREDQAFLELKGSGSGFQNFSGALMVDTLKLNGAFSFHYDEALTGTQPGGAEAPIRLVQ